MIKTVSEQYRCCEKCAWHECPNAPKLMQECKCYSENFDRTDPCALCANGAHDEHCMQKTKQVKWWEDEFRAKYEGANVWSSRSIDDVVSFISEVEERARREGIIEAKYELLACKRLGLTNKQMSLLGNLMNSLRDKSEE